MGSKFCWLKFCNAKALDEDHHVIMRTRGGEDSPTVSLCEQHHGEIHTLARSKISLNAIPNKQVRVLVHLLREAQKKLQHIDDWDITIKVPTSIHDRLLKDAKLVRKETKQPCSMQDIILRILIQHYKNRK